MSRFDFKKIFAQAGNVGAGVVGVGAVAVGGAYFVNSAIYTVDAGHRAIKFHRMTGIGRQTFAEGVHLAIPWFERPIIFDIKAKPHVTNSLTGTRDLQMVNITLRALCKPDAVRLSEIYQSVGLDWEEKVMPSITHEVLKSVVAQYNASELIIQREMVSRMIRQRLEKRANDFNIKLEDVALTTLTFSPEFEKAVEAKQVALQQAQKAHFQVLKAQEEKKRVIIHAEGERQSAEMIGSAIKNNPGFIELRRISVAKEVAGMLARSSNRMVLSTESLMLNLMGGNSSTVSSFDASMKKK
jgi:prohibitin 2